MGEITSMILDGILCELCGMYIGPECGFPRKCATCTKTTQKPRRKKKRPGGKTK